MVETVFETKLLFFLCFSHPENWEITTESNLLRTQLRPRQTSQKGLQRSNLVLTATCGTCCVSSCFEMCSAYGQQEAQSMCNHRKENDAQRLPHLRAKGDEKKHGPMVKTPFNCWLHQLSSLFCPFKSTDHRSQHYYAKLDGI